MTEVKIYTDGSARGNPDGPGGYGVVMHYVDKAASYMKRPYPQVIKRPQITVWS